MVEGDGTDRDDEVEHKGIADGGAVPDGGGGRRKRLEARPSMGGYAKPVLPPLRLNGMEGHDGVVRDAGRRRRRDKMGPGEAKGGAGGGEGDENKGGKKERRRRGAGIHRDGNESNEVVNGGTGKKAEVSSTLTRDDGWKEDWDGDETSVNDDDDGDPGGVQNGATLLPPMPPPPRYRATSASPANAKASSAETKRAGEGVERSSAHGSDEGAEEEGEAQRRSRGDQSNGDGMVAGRSGGAKKDEGADDVCEEQTGEGPRDVDEEQGRPKGERTRRPLRETLWDGSIGLAARHGVMCRRAVLGMLVFIVAIIVVSVREAHLKQG